MTIHVAGEREPFSLNSVSESSILQRQQLLIQTSTLHQERLFAFLEIFLLQVSIDQSIGRPLQAHVDLVTPEHQSLPSFEDPLTAVAEFCGERITNLDRVGAESCVE